MALKQHTDEKVRYNQQVDNSRSYIIPFVQKTMPISAGCRVLEVGTGEGGVLVPFIEMGCHCVGVDLAPQRIDIANNYMAEYVTAGKVHLRCQNIFEDAFFAEFHDAFDLIIMKDVIEHVPEQEKFIPYLASLLKPTGQIFFGFPPWYMPFGGHQQVCHVKWLSIIPYYHLLPNFLYRAVLKMGGEDDVVVGELMEIKETRISIERFERIVRNSSLKVLHKAHYLINPIYIYKFGIKPRLQWKPITYIPWFRDFVTTCVYYSIGK